MDDSLIPPGTPGEDGSSQPIGDDFISGAVARTKARKAMESQNGVEPAVSVSPQKEMNDFIRGAVARTKERRQKEQDAESTRQAVVNHLYVQSSDQTPESYAEAMRLSKTLNRPAGLIALDMDNYRAMAGNQKIAAVAERSRNVTRFLGKRENSILAAGDIDLLEKLEWESSSWIEKSPVWVADRGRDVVSGSVDVLGEGLQGLGEILAAGPAAGDKFLDDIGLGVLKPIMNATPRDLVGDDWLASIDSPFIADLWNEKPEDIFIKSGKSYANLGEYIAPPSYRDAGLASDVAKGLGGVAMQAAVYFANPVAGLGLMFGAEANEQAKNARAVGAQPSFTGMVTAGAINSALEKISLERMLKVIPGGGKIWDKVKDILGASATEFLTETAQSIVSDTTSKVTVDPNKTIGDQALYEGSVGAIVGGLFRTVVMGALHISRRSQVQQQAQTEQNGLSSALDNLASTKLYQIAPDKAGEAFAQITGADTIHIDAATFNQSVLQSGQEWAQPLLDNAALMEQVHAAAAAGETVAVPSRDLIGHVPMETLKTLLPDMHVRPDGVTPRVAERDYEAATQEYNQRMETALVNLENSTTVDPIYADVESQLRNAGLGINESAADATMVSERYTTRAARLSLELGRVVDPMTLYRADSLRVIGKNGAVSRNTGETINLNEDEAVTPSGTRIPVAYEVVEAADLMTSHDDDLNINPAFPKELQPRDRTRAASADQIATIAGNIIPELLGRSTSVSEGAPIVGRDGVVESGNGRVMGLRRAYSENGQSQERYRQWLESQGYNTTGMQQPVLIRRRVVDAPLDERIGFTKEANQRNTLDLGASEQAFTDAGLLTDSVLDQWRGGSIESGKNIEFVRAFVANLSQSERGAVIDANGALSKRGIDRIRAAMVAKAYGDTHLVARAAESLDDNIKTISAVLTSLAPQWAKMRGKVERGEIAPDMDQTPALMKAVQMVARARDKGEKVADLANQLDLFDQGSQETMAFLKLLYGPDLKRATGFDRLHDSLNSYITEAEKNTAGQNMFGEKPLSAMDILMTTLRKDAAREGTEKSGDLFGKSFNQASDLRPAKTFTEARQQAEFFKGKSILNDRIGMVAKVSRNNLDKMLSDSAAQKSSSHKDHALAVANIDRLFETSIYGWEKTDRDLNPNIKKVHRLFSVLPTENGPRLVKLTVKESAHEEQGSKIYTVESIEFNKETFASEWVRKEIEADGYSWDDVYQKKEMSPAVERVNATIKSDGFNPTSTLGTKKPHYAEDVLTLAKAVEDGKVFQQSRTDDVRANVAFTESGIDVRLFKNANASSFLHESGHIFLKQLTDDVALIRSQPGYDPAKPGKLEQDLQTVLDWMGAKEADSITTEQHEMFARGFEQYLRDGKAPSPALRWSFHNFREWLTRIYKRITDLKVDVSPEVKSVMDRLLAVDEAIAAQQEQNPPLLRTKPDDMTDDEWADYQDSVDRAAMATTEEVTEWALADHHILQSEDGSPLQIIKDAISNQVDADMKTLPVWAAVSLIRGGDGKSGPLPMNRDEVRRIAGQTALMSLESKRNGNMLAAVGKDGVHPQDIADAAGYPTAEALLKDLAGLPSKAEYRDRAVQAVLSERFGAFSEGNLPQAVQAALLNQEQARKLDQEYRILSRKRSSADTAARQLARTTLAQQNPNQARDFSKHLRASLRARREADVAWGQGDRETAIKAKEREIMAHALARESRKIGQEMDKAQRYLHMLLTSKQARLNIGNEAMAQVDALLIQADVPRPDKFTPLEATETLDAWQNRMADLGYDAVDIAPPKPWLAMTVGQVRDFVDTLKHIDHVGRTENKLLLEGEKQSVAEAASEMAKAVSTSKPEPLRRSGEMTPTDGDYVKDLAMALDDMLLRPEKVIEYYDKGDVNGVFNRKLWRPLKEAQYAKDDRMKDILTQFKALQETRSEGNPKGIDKTRYHIGGKDMTHDNLIAIGLNLGNLDNMKKLLRGYQWNEAVLDEVKGKLTKADFDFIQGVLNLFEPLFSELSAVNAKVNGTGLPRVEPNPIVTPYGTYPGGYYPLVYDPRNAKVYGRNLKDDGKTDLANISGVVIAPRHSSRKTRVDNVNLPVLLDSSLAINALESSIHDITHTIPVINARKLLNNAELQAALVDNYGIHAVETWRGWLNAVSLDKTQDDPVRPFDRFLKSIRMRSTVVALGYRISTVVSQLGGIPQAMAYLGPEATIKGFSKVYLSRWSNIIAAWDQCNQLSGEFRHRNSTLDRDVRENTARSRGKNDPTSIVTKHAFAGIIAMEKMISLGVWHGAYDQHLEKNPTDFDGAIAYANGAITKTQGSGRAMDLAPLMRMNEWAKLFTMFYTPFSAAYGQTHHILRDLRYGNFKTKARAFQAFMLLNFSYILPDLLMGRFPGEDDDESFLWWAVKKSALGQLAVLPFARDAAQFFDTGFNGTSAPERLITTAGKAITAIPEAITNDDYDWLDASIDIADAATYIMPTPAGQLVSSLRAWKQQVDGKHDESVRGILFGNRR